MEDQRDEEMEAIEAIFAPEELTISPAAEWVLIRAQGITKTTL